jgi:hypothetical protein
MGADGGQHAGWIDSVSPNIKARSFTLFDLWSLR